ncbi:lytic transglycosylase domain-containing protein [Nocardioides abyssi]|uniref:Lytic transglycosylase domain-containing protein n=1 Tax=Nocardioides abyssi TaxID=3058370 RepID=A0ABT8EPR9_9ACTN|nr:lytic transglycosylase domain-containing protein [Nocardioides abyssi]MDN4160145.1 lytic transglycosylase domain-containing protein [Nocardioides abyssi]
MDDSPVSKHVKHVPKHRRASEPRLTRAPRQALRTTALLSGVAVATTGAAVSGGVLSGPGAVNAAAGDVSAVADGARLTGSELAEDRASSVTRSTDRREQADPTKQATLREELGAAAGTGATRAITRTEDLSDADPRSIARAMLGEFGFSADQFSCLDSLWVSESDWRVDADNPTSSAYGIPQALTGMHELPADYMTSAASQIRWGLGYIRDAYGSPCNAWSFKQGNNWY